LGDDVGIAGDNGTEQLRGRDIGLSGELMDAFSCGQGSGEGEGRYARFWGLCSGFGVGVLTRFEPEALGPGHEGILTENHSHVKRGDTGRHKRTFLGQ
jgi:hypothetical protein